MAVDWERILETMGEKISGELADKVQSAIDEVKEYVHEAEAMTEKIRAAGPYIVNKRCARCKAIIRAPGHVCPGDTVVDVGPDNQGSEGGDLGA